ncbi:hypothetical protein WV31_11295 [Magnetospirillum sp. ME-1]|uniref:hypothetical protein n=1 Tax=Magnetospirillum sp. ME-1 TaxID=1639348 RepID=UPI000A17EA47|nr:hypothetical protein [Magnetospirillum sp. ME-1]ARJ66201.1 hypothetical protein WV31_11295 [Magnetospirillum sp. ME-1]
MNHRVVADLEAGMAVQVPLTAEEEQDLLTRRAAVGQREAEEARALIQAELARIDSRSVRPLRAILEAQTAGLSPESADMAMLAELNARAATLRAALVT